MAESEITYFFKEG